MASVARGSAVIGARAALVLLCVAGTPAWSLDWSRPWQVPQDSAEAVAESSAASDEFAWRLLIALLWPADARTGLGDPDAALGAARPCVWERWANSADVYRDDGADPGSWSEAVAPPKTSLHRFQAEELARLPNVRHIVAGRMQALRDPLEHSPRLVEIRMNEIAYDYVRKRGLYNLEGQIATVAAGVPIEFPTGAIEVKANWRVIAPSDAPRYHTLGVHLASGETRLYGLTALNIAAKESPRWFWASFEHVDNATRAGGEGWLLPSRDRYACGRAASDCDRAPAGIGLDQNHWRHYRLRGTQIRYLDDAGTPERLGNSELEAGLQESASCMTCHSRAALSVSDGVPRRLEVLAGPARRGYVGAPDPAWFAALGVDGRPLEFRSLDFVWSLAQAKPRRERSSVQESR
jgi:hypothetical protein